MNRLSDLQADWPAINRLLDEALELPPADRGAWLAALPPEAHGLRDTVARLLAATGGIETGDFMNTLPKLGAAPAVAIGRPDVGTPQTGDEVGPWRLVRELGEGGMGSVWLAERADGQLKRQVALKLPRLTWARGLAERMARERDILATLEHPHIARLYDAGVDKLGRPWLALEYVQGRPIDEHARDKALDVKQRVQLLLQVCEAVAYAHSRLVIHRDLKPGNILVTAEGQVKLLDFGIAKLMQGEQAGATALTEWSGHAFTLDYASPEQVRGEALTTASDVYSLGVVSYELLAGARPYQLRRGSAAELEEAIAQAEVPSASLSAATAAGAAAARALRGDIDAILHQALQREPTARYSGVAALATDLRRHRDGEPVSARPDTWAAKAARWLRRHRVEAAVVSAGALMLVGGAHAQLAVGLALAVGALLAVWQAQRSRHAAERALAQSARADAMQRFVLDLFRSNSLQQPDPLRAQATTARELLELGAQRLLDGEAGASPTLRGELLDAVFGLVHPLHLSSLAEGLAQQRVALRSRLHGPDGLPTLHARTDLAEVRLTLPERAQQNAEELDRLLAAVSRSVESGGALEGRVQRLLAQALAVSDPSRSLAHGERAVALLARSQPNSLAWAEACTDLVMPLLRAERNAEAERVGEGAVAALRGSGHDEELARAMVELAEAKAVMRHHDEAEALFREARTMRERRLGSGHPSSIYLLCKHATAQRSAGRWREAESLAALGIERCQAALGTGETHYLAMLRLERGRCLVLLGRFADARTELESALVCLDAWGSRHFGHAAALLALATAALGSGQFAQAAAHCDDVHELLAGLGFGPGTANQEFVQLLRADLAVAQGDAAGCELALANITPDPASDSSSMRIKGTRVAALRAEVALLRGQTTEALAMIEAALAALAARGSADAAAATTPGVVATAHETHARALLSAGRQAEAAAAVERALTLRSAHEAHDSGYVLAARALRARCG